MKFIHSRLLTSLSPLVLALAIGGTSAALPTAVSAEECLLDTNNNGVADAADTDGGATSNPTNNTLACGNNSTAEGGGSAAVGNNATADATAGGDLTAGRATAVGGGSQALNQRATAVGNQANASGIRSTATGSQANASGGRSTALGTQANALTNRSIAVGDSALVEAGTGIDGNAGGIAIGGDLDSDGVGANALGPRSIAIGSDAVANPEINGDPGDARATAIGSQAQATNGRATAVGTQAIAGGPRSTALGNEAIARGRASVAIGNQAETGPGPGIGARNAIAVGNNTNAQADGSVAIGADSDDNGAVATQENQFVLGTANHTYTAPGITSQLSRDRQSGPLELVTTDANGNLASDGGEIFRDLGKHGAGIAIATALENPDLVANETFGLAANFGFFEGNTAFALSAMGVLGHNFMGGGERWALSGGVGFSLNDDNYGGQDTDRTVAGRAGVQVSW